MRPFIKGNDLLCGRLGAECRHLCVDMQRLFVEDAPWRTPWMERIAPLTRRLTEHAPSRTIFTRFIPAARPGDGVGSWRPYYQRWADIAWSRMQRDDRNKHQDGGFVREQTERPMTGSSRNPLSRRELVGAVGTGLAAVSGRAAFAAASPSSPTGQPMTDPTTKYPRPPFNKQSQPWPGLAGKMEPKQDHGETSYRGAGRLTGRKALVTGGDSGMGRAAAIAFAREGADVAINHLPEEAPDAREVIELIKSAGRVGLSIPGDIRDEGFCQRLVEEAVRGLGGLDIVVSNAARQQSHASILDITSEQFDWTMKTNVYAPFWISRRRCRI
jgi:hypothetical protein